MRFRTLYIIHADLIHLGGLCTVCNTQNSGLLSGYLIGAYVYLREFQYNENHFTCVQGCVHRMRIRNCSRTCVSVYL